MEIPREELKEVIDRFEKDIEAGVSSRNWLPYLAKIRAWLASGPTQRAADVAAVEFCGDCLEPAPHHLQGCSHVTQRG